MASDETLRAMAYWLNDAIVKLCAVGGLALGIWNWLEGRRKERVHVRVEEILVYDYQETREVFFVFIEKLDRVPFGFGVRVTNLSAFPIKIQDWGRQYGKIPAYQFFDVRQSIVGMDSRLPTVLEPRDAMTVVIKMSNLSHGEFLSIEKVGARTVCGAIVYAPSRLHKQLQRVAKIHPASLGFAGAEDKIQG